MILVLGALRRPMTVLAAVLALLFAGWVAVRSIAIDIFPELDVPVIWVVQPYPGMTPEQMDGQFVYYFEYHYLYIAGIEHVESQSIQGMGVLKLYFHPGTDPAQAMAQVTAMTYRASSFLPPGTLPPFIVRFGAGSVPVAQLVFSSDTRSEAEIQDAALNRVRPLLATLPGVSAPPPSGGKVKMVVVDADPDRLRSYGLSPEDLAAALRTANLTLPSGNVRLGDQTAMVRTNAMVEDPTELARVPVRVGAEVTVFVGDVARVGLGADVVTNVALADGRRTVFMPVTKRADASTAAVMDAVRAALPKMREAVPDDVEITLAFDQSRFVLDAIWGLALEGVLGAALTGLAVLAFLRDWRSAMIVVLTIPLSVLGGIVALRALGQTLNLMTLGGLALAIGILVDEATVAIENVHSHLGAGKEPRRAVVDAMAEVRGPQLLAMACILAVLVPAFFVEGIARSLFPPLALAVGAAMVASYLVSSTVVPVLAAAWLRPHPARAGRLSEGYAAVVRWIVERPGRVLLIYALGAAPFALGAVWLPQRLFPATDTGELAIRIRAPAGMRLERTVALVKEVDDTVRQLAGAEHVVTTLANIGPPAWNVPVNAQYNDNTGPHDARLLVELGGRGRPAVSDLEGALRTQLSARYPQARFSFGSGDIVSGITNFGAADEVEVVVSAKSTAEARARAEVVERALRAEPALRDVRIPVALDYPTVEVAIDRERAADLGATTDRVARSVLSATSSSVLTTPLFWVDPATGTPYRVAVHVPERDIASEADLLGIPVSTSMLADVATVGRGTAPGEIDRYNGKRTVSVLARAATADLAAAGAAVDRALASLGPPPKGVDSAVRGQVAQMRTTLSSLRDGLVGTVVVVFLLLLARYQSVRVAAAITSVVPAVLCGVALALALTGTSWNVQSMMGAVMAIGVSVANAVLLVTVAVDRSDEGAPGEVVVGAAAARVRPIVMTSVAMIAGMLPTALALSEGGDASAPLGRAVIGGLAGSLVATLVFLPAVLAWLGGRGARPVSLAPEEGP